MGGARGEWYESGDLTTTRAGLVLRNCYTDLQHGLLQPVIGQLSVALLLLQFLLQLGDASLKPPPLLRHLSAKQFYFVREWEVKAKWGNGQLSICAPCYFLAAWLLISSCSSSLSCCACLLPRSAAATSCRQIKKEKMRRECKTVVMWMSQTKRELGCGLRLHRKKEKLH